MKSFLSIAVTFLLSSSIQFTNAFNPSVLSIYRPTTTSSFSLHAEANNISDRRGFLVTGGILAATSLSTPIMPAHADDVDYKAVARDIMDLVSKDPDKGPSELSIF